MSIKLFDSELRVMEILWREGDKTAKQIVDILSQQIGWNKNTTYTVIKKCIDKGAIKRTEPNFICHALIPREQVQAQETTELINKMFDGSISLLFASIVDNKNLSKVDIERLKQIVNNLN